MSDPLCLSLVVVCIIPDILHNSTSHPNSGRVFNTTASSKFLLHVRTNNRIRENINIVRIIVQQCGNIVRKKGIISLPTYNVKHPHKSFISLYSESRTLHNGEMEDDVVLTANIGALFERILHVLQFL